MIRIKSTLSKKDKQIINTLLYNLNDAFSDFYITKNNLRYYIKENLDLLYQLLHKGDKIIFDENGIGVILGWADKSPRKYLRLLTKDEKIADKLVKNINWNVTEELYCKIKKINPLKNILLRNKWKYIGNRGKEILLKREKIDIITTENKYD